MKIVRILATVTLLMAASLVVSAQQSTDGNVPVGKTAVIYSDAFLDPKTGVAKFNSLLNLLNREFQPRQAELQSLQTRINTIQKEIETIAQTADPNTVRTKRDQYEQLNNDFRRRGEDAEAAYTKRRQEIFTPLQQDINKALEAYAKARGITMIIDATNVPLVYASDSIDITRAFINHFNSTNPASASATQQ